MKSILTNKLRLSLFSICFLVILGEGLSQRIVTGTITDASNGEALVGATIALEDASNGTITDLNGKYTFNVTSSITTLVISYTGYTSQTLSIPENNRLDVELAYGETLDDVILIGYGEVKREDATGSIQSISSEDFNKGAIAGPQQLLAGKVAGVSITTDGNPGGGSTIRIRGESSLSASNDPLIVVDGVPLDNSSTSGGRNNLNIVNPNDIESMTVLKDASATAIYGNRASAGVILITTKKGKLGSGLRVGYSANLSIGNTYNRVDNLTAEQFRTLLQEEFEEGSEQLALLTDVSTDWQDEIYQQSIGHDHNLTLSGGLGNIPFRASMGYSDFNGLLKTDNFNRLTGNLNLTPGLIDNTLQLNLGLKISKTSNDFADNGAIGSAIGFDPTKPTLSGNDDFGGYFAWKESTGNLVGLAPANPVALLNQKSDVSDVSRYILNASADYRMPFLKKLRANINVAYDISNSDGTIFIDTTAAFSYNPQDGGGTNNSYNQEKNNSLLEFYLNYKDNVFGRDIDIMAGYSWQHFKLSNDFRNSNVAGTIVTEGSDASELYMLSLFGRLNYELTNRVNFTGTLRNDYTSRFSPETRSGLFPSAAVAIKARETPGEILNNVKIRLGWGITGQQDIGGYYLYQGLYQQSFDNARYQFGDGYLTTYRPNGYDSGIKWETTTTYNLGVDYSIVRNRIGGSIDIYQRNTKDLLNQEVQVTVGSNLTNIIPTNIGDMETKGVELALNLTPILNEKISWDINLNAAFNKNKITKLNQDEGGIGEAVGGISGGVGNTIQVHTVGYEPFSFFVFEQDYDEAGSLIPGQYVDRNEDGLIDELDKYRIEASRPNAVFGISNTITYGKFNFAFAGRANVGNKVYNNVQTDIGWKDRLDNLGILNNVHSVVLTNDVRQQSEITFSDAFVKDASFFRIDYISLGYTFDNLIGRSLTLSATVQNPIILTSYEGLDPEVFGGIDNNRYPRPRTFVFGLNVNF
ncbi:MAG: TonB-linked SusC/RagA family outer membrane protein [Saprospiraceae bacterium]|jgi:TonB-linked SusC/RagA family outer membrane protein